MGEFFSINPSLIPSRGNYPSGGILRLMGKTLEIFQWLNVSNLKQPFL